MASTITDGTLIVKISESLLFNGEEQGATTTAVLTGIDEVAKRIVRLTADTNHNIAKFAGTKTSESEYDVGNLQYVRITNLDDTATVIASYNTTGPATATLPIKPGGSLLLFGKGANGIASDTIPESTLSLENIYLRTSRTGVDVEFLIATQ